MAAKRVAVLFSSILNRGRDGLVFKQIQKQKTRSFSTSSTRCFGTGVETGKVRVDGVDLYYEKVGRGDHHVLLLPGALGCTKTDFLPQLEKLDQEKFTIFGWDPRGFGKSRPPNRNWPLNFYNRDAEDAVGLLKALGVERVSLLGWSDGGNTALIIAGTYKELCRNLVVWGSNAYVTDKDVKDTQAIKDTDKWSARMKQPFIDLYGEDHFCTLWTGWVDAYHRIYKEKQGDICKMETSKISCPTLIIHGQKDALVDQEHPDYLHSHIKNSRLVNWPEAKHNLHLRYADDFNKLVQDFLLKNS